MHELYLGRVGFVNQIIFEFCPGEAWQEFSAGIAIADVSDFLPAGEVHKGGAGLVAESILAPIVFVSPGGHAREHQFAQRGAAAFGLEILTHALHVPDLLGDPAPSMVSIVEPWILSPR